MAILMITHDLGVVANVADEIYATGGSEEMANRLWAKAGLGPGDVGGNRR